jgi:hypothetical protein
VITLSGITLSPHHINRDNIKGINIKQHHIKITLRGFRCTVKPVYNGHPWDPKKVVVVQSWPVFTGFSIKIGIKSSLAGLRLVVVARWLLTQVLLYFDLFLLFRFKLSFGTRTS